MKISLSNINTKIGFIILVLSNSFFSGFCQIYNGNALLYLQAHVDTFHYQEVTGDLEIFGGATNPFNLDSLYQLTKVGGSLILNELPAVDNFNGLGNLDSIGGDLIIGNPTSALSENTLLTNLDPLANLTYVGGSLRIHHYNALKNIDGLSSLSSINGDLMIDYNDSLMHMDGFLGLVSIGGNFEITGNQQLLNLNGLSNVIFFGGNVHIRGNNQLPNLDGLEGVDTVFGDLYIQDNHALQNMDALSNMLRVDGYFRILNSGLHHLNGLNSLASIGGDLFINQNSQLISIVGLGNVTETGGDITIGGNQFLTNLSGLQGITEVSGYLSIHGNTYMASIEGLENISIVRGELQISSNELISNVDPLANLDTVGSILAIYGNDVLLNVNGLNHPIYVDSTIDISNNQSLNECCGILPHIDSLNLGNLSVWGNGQDCTIPIIQANGPCVYPFEIILEGNVYGDMNQNCLPDSTDFSLANWMVLAEPGPYVSLTDSLGNFSMTVDTGDYTYSAFPILYPMNDTLCDTVYTVSVDSTQSIIQLDDIGVQVDSCPDFDVSIGGFWNRRCFSGYVTVSYCNYGFFPASQTELFVRLPDNISLLSASQAFSYSADSTLIFQVGTIDPFSCHAITIQTQASCDDVQILGVVHCIEAWMTSASDCPLSNPTWSGASSEWEAQCVEDSINQFLLINRGTANMIDSASYRIYADSSLVAMGEYYLNLGDTLEINIPGDGKSYRVEAKQELNHPSNQEVSIALEGCVVPLDSSTSRGVILQFPPAQPYVIESYSTNCAPIIGAYDPNDKQVQPTGFGASGYTLPYTQLQYQIRFQNTGNDTAFRIVIIDTLAPVLDIQSLQFGNSSHPYQLEVEDAEPFVLKFVFDNILLPDSNVNEAASHGFIKFSITHQEYSFPPLGAVIENFADIYFDFNPPIRTNTTVNTISEATYEAIGSISDIELEYLPIEDTTDITGLSRKEVYPINVFPNPFTQQLTIDLGYEHSAVIIEIYSLFGKKIQSISYDSFMKDQLEFPYPAGIYFLRIQTGPREYYVKVLKE